MSKRRRSATECLKKKAADLTPWERSKVKRMKRRAKDPIVQRRVKARSDSTVVKELQEA